MPEVTRHDDPALVDSGLETSDLSGAIRVGVSSGPPASAPAEIGIEMEAVQVFEEVASISKHAVVTGRMRVSTRTETVDEVVSDTLTGQTVEVERVRLDRLLAIGEAVPQIRTEGEVTIIPVVEEVLVSEKRLRLKEELHIIRRVNASAFRESVSLRRQVATVERLDPKPTPGE